MYQKTENGQSGRRRTKGAALSGDVSAVLIAAISAVVFFVGWFVLAAVLDDPRTLPAPLHVVSVAIAEARSGELFHHMAATGVRVISAFTLAMCIGCAAGLALGRSRTADDWFNPWVVFFLNLPALIVIVLCYLWIGLTEVAAITAVALTKIFPVLVTVREGARTLDPELDDMAHIYRMPLLVRLRHVIVPQLAPFIAASARNGLSIIWKIVLVAEFLGRGDGIGFQIHLYFQLFEISYVLAYSLSFVLVMLVIEYAFVQRLERSASRWRTA